MEGRQQPTVEELLNKIIFLRKALEFYANEKNYDENKTVNTELVSMIEIDKGSQARFALEQTKLIENYNQSLIDGFNNVINDIEGNTPEERMNDLQEKINVIYKTIDKYDK